MVLGPISTTLAGILRRLKRFKGDFDVWDLSIMAGLGLISWGIGQIHPPFGLIAAGVAFVLVGLKAGG